jgi:hypothetical protein
MIPSLYNFAYYGNWRASVVLSTARGNRREATEAITDLYESYGRLPPWVVWCEGPFQAAAMHAILPKVFASPQWETISRYFKHNVYPERDWTEQWEQLYSTMIEPQMVAASQSISPTYTEPKMFEDLKEVIHRELDRRLRAEARSSDEVRQTLRRELRNAAGYQHLGLKLTSAIFKRISDYSVRMNGLMRGASASHNVIAVEDVEASALLTSRQCQALQTALREGMRLYGGICAEVDAMIIWGSWSIPWLERYIVYRTANPSQFAPDMIGELDAFGRISQNSLGVLCTEALCFACEKPVEIVLDERRRPHNMNGPSLQFSDGFKAYAVEGVALDKRIVENPDGITADLINNARNAEVRRVIMQIYGAERFLKDGHAVLVQEDECGELYEVAMPGMLAGPRGEPLVFVRVKNSTPEPDGTYKFYILRVPPRCRTAREAVAWTFGLREDDYAPSLET